MLNVGKMSGNEHLQMCVLPPQISIFKKIFYFSKISNLWLLKDLKIR